MTTRITRRRSVESLKEAASWPDADRTTMVILAAALVAADADAEAADYFGQLSDDNAGNPTALSLAGYFQLRAGQDGPDAISKLDKAATMDLGLPQYYRGLALAALLPAASQTAPARPRQADPAQPQHADPARPRQADPAWAEQADRARAEQVVADLEFVLAVRDQFPPGLLRGAYHGLARAYRVLGKDDQAAEALASSGLASASGQPDAEPQLIFTNFSVSARDGMRMGPPRLLQPEPNVHVAMSYDFGDFAFVDTGAGIVAIDAGTSADRVLAAMTDLGLQDAPITHLILTHAHFDHIGGVAALRGPGTEVIAAAGFAAEVERLAHAAIPFQYFTGTNASPAQHVEPTRLISEPTSLVVGGTEFVLRPATGGETADALMVHLPASGLLFTGDVMMPYLGAPFFAEGSPEGLLDTLRYILELDPRQLIQGHTPLTETFTLEALAGLEPALAELHDFVLARISENMTLPRILDLGQLPALLREHPAAVLPYLVCRDHFIARLYHQRTGYWQPDAQGLDPRSPADRAAALDLLAGGEPQPFVTAAASLAGQGDHTLALELLTAGLLQHPDSSELAGLRQTVLSRLMAEHQVTDPFRFLVYAELAGAELEPVR